MRFVMSACLALVLALPLAGLAAAAPQSPPPLSLNDFVAKPPTKVGYRDYCVRQYFKCRHFSDNGWEFRKCMQWKGCWEDYKDHKESRSENSCRDWGHACAENWGHGTNDFFGCLRFHGCD